MGVINFFWLEVKMIFREKSTLVYSLLFPLFCFFLFVEIFPSGADTEYAGWLASGMVGLSSSSLCLISAATDTAQRRQYNVLKFLRTRPITPVSYMVSQIGKYLVASLINATVIIIGAMVYGAFPSNPLLLLAFFLLGTSSLLALGLIVGSMTKTGNSAYYISSIIFYPMIFLCPVWWSFNLIPAFIQPAVKLLPLYHLVELCRSAYLGTSIGFIELIIPFIWLILGFLVSSRLWRWTS